MVKISAPNSIFNLQNYLKFRKIFNNWINNLFEIFFQRWNYYTYLNSKWSLLKNFAISPFSGALKNYHFLSFFTNFWKTVKEIILRNALPPEMDLRYQFRWLSAIFQFYPPYTIFQGCLKNGSFFFKNFFTSLKIFFQ